MNWCARGPVCAAPLKQVTSDIFYTVHSAGSKIKFGISSKSAIYIFCRADKIRPWHPTDWFRTGSNAPQLGAVQLPLLHG